MIYISKNTLWKYFPRQDDLIKKTIELKKIASKLAFLKYKFS
ncbi:hypothetical protein GJA_1422 [Janthinobacterium agaricidamnosum NBRC 102515 = DSM 9628]|uniref:Uncharacterized protein n=1 Tax=Janthinobacterium agaricidamnosum NBRC 102515 = DSM 9628 TaxID=1349767 RepID=W0V3B1_9BURK|nr:hypothetical protein GJA_1422 [Janthinobacterium agaricidamnosum NBRC 102515 = DSM 9628]